MTRKHDAIVQELELSEVEGFTEAQKTYYVSLGFRPFRNASGKIKWLMPDQHSLRIVQAQKRHWLSRVLFPKMAAPQRRHKHRKNFVKFIRINWLFIIISLVIAVIVLFLLRNPQIIM